MVRDSIKICAWDREGNNRNEAHIPTKMQRFALVFAIGEFRVQTTSPGLVCITECVLSE